MSEVGLIGGLDGHGVGGQDLEQLDGLLVFGLDLVFGDLGALLEVHEVEHHLVADHPEPRVERLVRARVRDDRLRQRLRVDAAVLVREVDLVDRLVDVLVQVPDVEVFVHVHHKELSQSRRKV